MSINKNFVVRHGFEASTDLILADADTRKVGIGTTNPQFTLDVAGGIGATDFYLTGIGTFVDELNVGLGGTILTVLGLENSVGIGTALPAYLLDIRSPVLEGQTALYVQGDVEITGDILIDNISVDDAEIENLNVTDTLFVVGLSTFNSNVFIDASLNVSGISTLGKLLVNSGIITATSGIVTYYGDGQYLDLTNNASTGIGIGTTGGLVGYGITFIDFYGSGVSAAFYDSSVGIATIFFEGGTGGGDGGPTQPTTKTTVSFITSFNQTTFPVSYNSAASVNVYLNGAFLSESEYIATSGTEIVLNYPSSENDILDVVVFDFGNSLQGSQGVQGIQGIPGIQGLDGLFAGQGIQGLQGPQGVQGTQGIQGVQGLDGLFAGQGIQGLQGIQGVQGTQGIQGVQGLDGLFAGQGVQGIQGNQGNDGTDGGFTVVDDTSTNATRYILFDDAISGTVSSVNVSSTKLTFNPSTGQLTAVDFNSTSDKNLKENIRTLSNSMDILDKINPVKFKWKNSEEISYGVIAQEIENILPELVKKSGEYKSVSYIPLIALLIDAIKTQNTELNELRRIIQRFIVE